MCCGALVKIALLNYSDTIGGAARAAYRIHHALRQQGMDSTMYVNQANAGDWSVKGPVGKWGKIRAPLGGLVTSLLKTGNSVFHSPAILPSTWPNRLNNSDADVIHLHWVNNEMLSIGDIGRLRKPVVWTLHDMWAFCGAEHNTEEFRWRDGYTSANRPPYESGFDLNHWTWKRKRKHWKHPMHIVTPSRWLADCVCASALMNDWPVHVIPNAIDTETWQPVPKALARRILHLPADVPILLFGAIGGTDDHYKGFDLLHSALQHLRGQVNSLQLVIFGQLAPRNPDDLGVLTHFSGHLHDDLSLRILYSAADAIVVPSRQEAFGQTASEALACGTPVVAFGATGLLDVVLHQHTGYLAKPFDVEDLANGICWVLQEQLESESTETLSWLGANARHDAITRFSNSVVAKQYLEVYRMAVGV
jgi:glycosyltransferase involved in cell wall biosynthesis